MQLPHRARLDGNLRDRDSLRHTEGARVDDLDRPAAGQPRRVHLREREREGLCDGSLWRGDLRAVRERSWRLGWRNMLRTEEIRMERMDRRRTDGKDVCAPR